MKKRKLYKALLILIICGLLTCSYIKVNNYKETVSNTSIMYYENVVAITFDDGPRRDTTVRLLDGLKELNVKATFFVMGKNIIGNEDIIKRMYDDGNLIGNHTYSHIELCEVSHDKAVEEIESTNDLIYDITGYIPKYIRPPFGSYNDKLQLEINMTPVLWSVDPNDWNTTDVAGVVNSVMSKVKSGDIILLHDFYDSSVTAALEIIAQLKAKGYIFVTVDQIILD